LLNNDKHKLYIELTDRIKKAQRIQLFKFLAGADKKMRFYFTISPTFEVFCSFPDAIGTIRPIVNVVL